MSNKSVVVVLEAQSEKFSPVIQQGVKDMAKLRAEVETLRKGGEGSDAFSAIRKSLGNRSALGESADLLNGGGGRLIGGLTGGADAIKNMATEAARLRQEFAAGKLSAGEMTEKIAEGIPLIGSFWSAGRAVRELFTNEAEDLAKANAEAKLMATALQAERETMDLLAAGAKSFGDYMAEAAKEIARATLPLLDAQRVVNEIEAQKKSGDLEQQRREELKRAAAISKPAIEAANAANSENDNGGPSWWDKVRATHGDLEAEQTAKDLRRQQARMVAANAIKTQMQAEAEINARFDAEARKASQVNDAQAMAEDYKGNEKQREAMQVNARQIADMKAETDQTLLESMDKKYDAELVGLRHSLANQLDEIRKGAADQEKARGLYDDASIDSNGAMEDAKKQAAIDAESAKEMKARHEETMRQSKEESDMYAAMNEDRDKAAEDGRRLTEDSKGALQKYQDQISEIQNLQANGAITDDTAAAATAKANKELSEAAGGTTSKAVGAEVRRFDRDVDRKGTVDPIRELVNQQKANNEAAKKSASYLEQIYNLQHNDNSIVVNSL